MALYSLFLVSLIPVYHHRIWYFPVMGGVKRGWGWGVCMFLKKGGISRTGEMKKERGLIHLSEVCLPCVNTLLDTIIYLMEVKYLNIRLRHIY